MELTGSALTALFVGLVWALIKVVEFFVSKYKNNKEVKGLTNDQSNTLQKVSENVSTLCDVLNKQSESLSTILAHSKHLDNMHSVYNDDHAPAWYVPPGLISLVRENNNLCKDMEERIDEMKGDQGIIVGKMSDLISSQKLVTERLGDLISTLNKISR